MIPVTINTPTPLPSTDWLKLYTFPSSGGHTYGVFSVIVTNDRAAGSTTNVSLDVGPGGTSPIIAGRLENNTPIPSPGGLERGNIILSPGESIWVRANFTDTTIRIHGLLITTAIYAPLVVTAHVEVPHAVAIHTLVDDGTVLYGTMAVNLLNLGPEARPVSLGFDTGASSDIAWIEQNTVFTENNGVERNCIIMSPGERVLVDVWGGTIPGPISYAVRLSGILRLT